MGFHETTQEKKQRLLARTSTRKKKEQEVIPGKLPRVNTGQKL